MRIVHEIADEVQIGLSGQHYSYKVVDRVPPPYHGGRVDMIIVSRSTSEKSEALYIEGDLDTLRAALQQALDQLQGLDSVMREGYAEDVARNWQERHDRYWREHGDAASRLAPGETDQDDSSSAVRR